MNSEQILDPSRPSQVKAYLQATGFRPSAVMGQNFLIDRNVLDRMIEAAGVRSSETVLEIGPGLGVLTAPLLACAGKLIAVEKDARLYAGLGERFGNPPNAVFLLGDFLDLADRDPSLLSTDAVVSNLPYSVAARILVTLALADEPPGRMLVTIQKEVAERLTAPPGSPEYGLLSVLIGDGYDTELMRTISPSCFYPVPAVWSAFVRLRRRPGVPPRPASWLTLVRHAFSRRRKQMTTILVNGPWDAPATRPQALAWLQAAGISPTARPETLGADQWRNLAHVIDEDKR